MTTTAAAIAALAASIEGDVAVFARRLDVPEAISWGPVDELFPTGSAAKVLVLLAFADLVTAGAIAPEQRVTLATDYRDARLGSGVLRHLAGGLEPTLHDCAMLMMIVSDNVATDLLLDALGGYEAVNATVAALGVEAASVTSPSVWVMPPKQFGMASARGLAEVWSLVAGDDPRAELCRRITWRHQQREGFGRLVPFLPDLVDFGGRSKLGLWSKSGSYPSVSCEAGLFETDRARWVLAVMARRLRGAGNSSAAPGPTLRAEVSRLLYDLWGS